MSAVAQAFRKALIDVLRQNQGEDPQLASFVAEIEAMDCSRAREILPQARPAAVERHLGSALAALTCAEPLAQAVRDLAEPLPWYQIFQGDGIEPNLAAGLVAGQVAGQVGLVESQRIRTGLFLLAPGIHYPLHQHAALELYYVVSGALTLQWGRGGTPFTLTPDQWSVTPCHQLHALTIGDAPCLLIYAWVGEVEAPNWWWEKDGAGQWQRVCWERQPDARWLRTRKEAITAQHERLAGEA